MSEYQEDHLIRFMDVWNWSIFRGTLYPIYDVSKKDNFVGIA